MDEDTSPPPQLGSSSNRVFPAAGSSTIIATGPLRLVTLQEPQENFHKDEGGKANVRALLSLSAPATNTPRTQQLTFRVILQGELTPEVLGENASVLDSPDGYLALSVRPIFDDGELADPSVLEIVGGTEGPQPCIQLSTRLGGVRYRLRTVSKRLGNRGIGVICEVVGCGAISALKSETTMVFSKRKNKEQRLEEQARERSELLERQRAAASLLNTRSISSSNVLNPALTADQSQQYAVRLPSHSAAHQQHRGSSSAGHRKLSTATADSDSDDSFEEAADSTNSRRKRAKPGSFSLLPTPTQQQQQQQQQQQRKVEDRLLELEAAHERLKQEVDYLRGSIHLHLLQNTRSSSINSQQAVAWEFADPSGNISGGGGGGSQGSQNGGGNGSVASGGGGVGGGHTGSHGGLSGMISPPPSRTPLGEIESQWNPPALRRDLSTSSQCSDLIPTHSSGMMRD